MNILNELIRNAKVPDSQNLQKDTKNQQNFTEHISKANQLIEHVKMLNEI